VDVRPRHARTRAYAAVAGAAEELSASVAEIGRQVRQSASAVEQTGQRTEKSIDRETTHGNDDAGTNDTKLLGEPIAALRPLAPHIPAPGNVAAPVRYRPLTAVSYLVNSGLLLCNAANGPPAKLVAWP